MDSKWTLKHNKHHCIIVNQGENGGQTVLHLHIHVLGGERLTGF